MDIIEGLVSVIMPMYNAQQYIAMTIDSVIAQTYENWEMIIVDDCSVDGCDEIVKNYIKKDNRIHYYRNEQNMGVAATRNCAIMYARGQYIAFLDSDDLWKPDKLKKQLVLMKNEECSFCYGSCEVINQNGMDIGKTRIVPSTINYRQLLKGNDIPCLTVVIDRGQIPDIIMPQIPHEDYATWLTLLKDYHIIAYGIQDVIAVYRERIGSVSGKKGHAMRWTWNIYRDYLNLSYWQSVVCFVNYMWKAIKKRL